MHEFSSDPYTTYAWLRAADPVHHTPQGLWVVTRYDDVATILRDPRFGRAAFNALFDSRTDADRTELDASMLYQDPPRHARLRTLAGRAVTRSTVERLRPRVQAIVNALIDRVYDGRAFDLIAEFAFPLPVLVITELLGVPAGDRDRFLDWAGDVARTLDAGSAGADTESASVDSGHAAIADYFGDLIARRRRCPQEDLVSALIAANDDGDTLTDAELLTTCGLLFAAGHETTVNLIGNGMLALLQHPTERRRLHDSAELVVSAVEELLRYDSPVQRAGRITMDDVEVGGRTIAKGQIVLAMIGAANRDPAAFAEPDTLDVTRRDNRHLAFGAGIHFCLGASLARLNGQVAIGTLVRRLPELAIATQELEWRGSTEIRGLKRLPLTVE